MSASAEPCSPTERDGLRQALALRKPLGISRIADLTGLDTVGIPVAQAVQPFSLSLAVAQGKGLTPAQAILSAVMECAETFCAEKPERFATIRGSAARLGVPNRRFEAFANEAGWHDEETDWIECEEIVCGGRALVPFDLVHTAYLQPADGASPLFTGSTTGLAAGFSQDQATLHALLECVERDALARAHASHGFLQRNRIDPSFIGEPCLLDLLRRLEEKGFLVGLWHMPSPTGIPAIWCHLLEDRPSETAILPFPAEGTAARADGTEATVCAILEAAQSRLAAISGAREDITRAQYPAYPDRQHIEAHRRLIAEGPRTVALSSIADGAGASSADLVARLAACGNDAVYRIAMGDRSLPGISVVRTIVPGLMPFYEA
ncbi:MAG: YcaO-like family protein [Rhizobiaceae bacterium]|nr:YcaO-like family protein [Rhizobiaceae bacterium]